MEALTLRPRVPPTKNPGDFIIIRVPFCLIFASHHRIGSYLSPHNQLMYIDFLILALAIRMQLATIT